MPSLQVSVRLNPSFDEWYGARAVVEEELQAIGKALERIRISCQLQDAFTGHLFAVHRQWCEACPPARDPGLSGGGLEKESTTNIHNRAAAAHTPMKQKTSVSCVSTFTQTTDMNGLQLNAQGEVDGNNDDISDTSVPSVTCVEGEQSQADVNSTLEKPSSVKVVSSELIKLEVSEDVQFSDVPLRLEGDNCDVDMDNSKEETTSQQIHEEELPPQHTESGEQSHLERTNTVSDLPIKHERDSQGHSNFNMAGSSSEEMSHQGPVEEIPFDRSDGQLHLEGMNAVSDQLIKQEEDSQGHCDFDMAGSSSEAMSLQGPMEEIPHDRSDQHIEHERDSRDHRDFYVDGSSKETYHQGPVEEIALDRADGTYCDVLSQEGVFKDPCLDSYKKVQKTCQTDDRTNNSALDCEVLGPSGVSADQCPTDLDSNKNVEKTSVPDDGTNHASPTLSCDALLSPEVVSADHCLAGLDSFKKVQTNSGSDSKMKFQHSDYSERYSCMNEYQEHLGTHTCQKPYQCSLCSKRFIRKDSFDTHMMQPKGEKPFKCDHCYYQCKTKQTLTDYTKVHAEACKCSSCDKIYYHKGDMERHIEKPFKCDHCNSKIVNPSNCQVHRRTIEIPYKCDYCTYTCATKQHLETHMRVHTGERPHECSLCGKRFTHSYVLKIHLRTHSGERPYRCDICDYKCSSKGSLTRHMGVHSGEKPHECSLCGKRFLHSSDLKRHMRIHSGEKPYRCDICDYRCSEKAYLTKHMKVHTGEKPHGCSLCEKRFTRSRHLKRHMRTHSGEKL